MTMQLSAMNMPSDCVNHLELNIKKNNYVICHSPKRKISEPISIKIGRKRIRGEIQ